MDMITGYFMAPVRGKDGDNVSREKKWENIRIALNIAEWLKRKFLQDGLVYSSELLTGN